VVYTFGEPRANSKVFMRSITKILAILLVLAIGGLAVFLATWDIPAPSQKVEKVLRNDRFPR
jgi:hypothetical protein